MKKTEMDDKEPSLCGYCQSPVQTTRGVDQRFKNDKMLGWLAECSNDNCINSPTFTRGDLKSAIDSWNTFWATHKDNV